MWRQAAGVQRARGDLTSAQPLAASAGRPLCTALCSGSAASSTARWVRSSICLRSGSVVSRNLAEKGCKQRTGQAHGMWLSIAPRAQGPLTGGEREACVPKGVGPASLPDGKTDGADRP